MLWDRPLLPWQRNLGTKAHITRLVWQIDRRCLHLPWGFRGWPIQRNHAKCCGADPCCHGNEICANLGYFLTKSAMSRLVCHIHQICLGLRGETTSGADLCCYRLVNQSISQFICKVWRNSNYNMATRVGPTTFCMVPLNRPSPNTPC